MPAHPDSMIAELWSKPAIVVRGAYERSSPLSYTPEGRVTYTEINMCIDVLLEGQLIEGVRAEDFERYVVKTNRS